MSVCKLENVFGVSNEKVLSYITRTKVDGLFEDALKTDKQIIVYGSSKQGKTALVEKHIPYEENIVIRCTPQTTILDINRSILRSCKIEVTTESSEEKKTEGKVSVGAKFKAIIPLLGGGEGSIKTESGAGTTTASNRKCIEFNLNLAQDVSELLKETNSKKFIILENFHYLSNEVQKDLAFDLRSFQEMGIRFVVLGVWREKNRLTQFNGDLQDRMVEVPVEPWEKSDFLRVIMKGSKELNIVFSSDIINAITSNAFDSIGVVQELLKVTCRLSGVVERKGELFSIDNDNILKEAIKSKAEDYSSRHSRALEDIAEGRKAKAIKADEPIPLFLPYYLVKSYMEFSFEEIVAGIRRADLETKIKSIHHRPNDVRPGDMSNLLHNFAKLQHEKRIVPPIFDYDQNARTLRIVDSTFYFFLRNVDRESISENLINPLEKVVMVDDD